MRHSSSSKLTLQPASQNFLVEISDVCDNPGTMCASVISLGNHGMSRLHVWVERIFSLLGSRIWMGFVAIFLLTMGAPSIRKWPVAPESEMAYSIALVSRRVSNIMSDCGEACKLRSWMIVVHAVRRVGIVMVVAIIGSISSRFGSVISLGMIVKSSSDVIVRLGDWLDIRKVALSSWSLHMLSL